MVQAIAVNPESASPEGVGSRLRRQVERVRSRMGRGVGRAYAIAPAWDRPDVRNSLHAWIIFTCCRAGVTAFNEISIKRKIPGALLK